MEYPILITWLNDYQFCPASIYFHNLYGNTEKTVYQDTYQLNGTAAHAGIDSGGYSTRRDVLSGISVFSEQYGLTGKIDLYYSSTGELVERKKKIKTVFDGYVLQLYGQCFALREMGYTVKKLTLRSLDDNRRFPVALPEDDPAMTEKLLETIRGLQNLRLETFVQSNRDKCAHCIYEPLCDSSLTGGEQT